MTIKILNEYQYSYIRIQITYIGIRIYSCTSAQGQYTSIFVVAILIIVYTVHTIWYDAAHSLIAAYSIL